MAWQCRILVTGSRDWPDTDVAHSTVYCAVIEAAANLTSPAADGTWATVTLVHGDARGLDRMAARVAVELGMQVEAHRPNYRTDGARAPLARNQRMVGLGADVVLGFPLGTGWSGTRHCLQLARRAGLHVIEVTSCNVPGSAPSPRPPGGWPVTARG